MFTHLQTSGGRKNTERRALRTGAATHNTTGHHTRQLTSISSLFLHEKQIMGNNQSARCLPFSLCTPPLPSSTEKKLEGKSVPPVSHLLHWCLYSSIMAIKVIKIRLRYTNKNKSCRGLFQTSQHNLIYCMELDWRWSLVAPHYECINRTVTLAMHLNVIKITSSSWVHCPRLSPFQG